MKELSKFDLDNVLEKFNSEKNSLPGELGEIALKDFQENFETESFFGTSWKKKKFSYKYGNKLLENTGVLKDSLKVTEKTFDKIVIETTGSANEYAAYQNDGTDNIPARPFVGSSEKLDNDLLKKIEKDIDKIFD